MLRKLKPDDTLVIKSIDRLGRDYVEILEQWKTISEHKKTAIVVLDMPILDTRNDKDLVGKLISDIVLQLLSYVAQTEREFIRQRQAEGIAAAQARGVKFGRPPLTRPNSLDYYTSNPIISITANITSAGYATFSSTKAVDFSNTNLTVYTAKDNGTSVTLNEVESKKGPANTAVVLKGEEGDYTGTVVASADALTDNDLKVAAEDSSYTRPEDVQEFVERTGCDSLAIAIGTSHGAYKFTPAQCTRNEQGILVPPPLRFDILEEVSQRLPGFPIVLHGSSSVPQEYVRMINDNGGKMPDAVGIPEEQLRKAAAMAVCKINIDSDLRLAMTAGIRQHFNEHPEHFDPRQYLTVGRDYIRELVKDKIVNVLGSDGKI